MNESTVKYFKRLLGDKKHPTGAEDLRLRQAHDYGLSRPGYQFLGNSPAWLDQGIADLRRYVGGGVENEFAPTVDQDLLPRCGIGRLLLG